MRSPRLLDKICAYVWDSTPLMGCYMISSCPKKESADLEIAKSLVIQTYYGKDSREVL